MKLDEAMRDASTPNYTLMTNAQGALVQHWLKHGPKLLEALKNVNDSGAYTSADAWNEIEVVIEAAEEVEGI